MRYTILYYAGYKHISCDPKTHTHRLLNLKTNEVEVWRSSRDTIGLPYKNTHLVFIDIEVKEKSHEN